MPSLKDVKMKISGVRKTKQITKAMNMVASAKLRGAQSRIERFRPYADKFFTVLSDLAGKADGVAHPLLEQHAEQKNAVVVLSTSDRGLCGGFNANLIAKSLDLARRLTKEGKSVSFICVGKKGRDAIRKSGFTLKASFVDQLNSFDFSLATRIGKELVSEYITHDVDEVVLVYGAFVSLSRQVPTVQPLLPVTKNDNEVDPKKSVHNETTGNGTVQNTFAGSRDYLYEPDVKVLLAELLPRFINVQVYRSLLDTSASENASRMTAMDNATRNCDDMVGALTLLYNKTRQASITNELIDIVGGAEALK